MEVVGVPEDDLCPHGAKLVRGDSLDGRLRAHRHENRRLHVTAAGVEDAGSSFARGIGVKESEGR
jgi:hypothetical protein